jgi:hypothetical protein
LSLLRNRTQISEQMTQKAPSIRLKVTKSVIRLLYR